MTISSEYVERKLKDLSNEASLRIGEAVLKVQRGAARDGATGGSLRQFYAPQALEDSFREYLLRVARFAIDVQAYAQPETEQLVLTTASGLASEVVERHAVALFGSPAFDPRAGSRRFGNASALKAKLQEVSRLIVEDMKHGIVGHTRHEPTASDQSISISANNSNLVVSSPGAIVRQVVQHWDTGPLASALDEIDRRIQEFRLDQDDLDDVRAQIASLQAQLGASVRRRIT